MPWMESAYRYGLVLLVVGGVLALFSSTSTLHPVTANGMPVDEPSIVSTLKRRLVSPNITRRNIMAPPAPTEPAQSSTTATTTTTISTPIYETAAFPTLKGRTNVAMYEHVAFIDGALHMYTPSQPDLEWTKYRHFEVSQDTFFPYEIPRVVDQGGLDRSICKTYEERAVFVSAPHLTGNTFHSLNDNILPLHLSMIAFANTTRDTNLLFLFVDDLVQANNGARPIYQHALNALFPAGLHLMKDLLVGGPHCLRKLVWGQTLAGYYGQVNPPDARYTPYYQSLALVLFPDLAQVHANPRAVCYIMREQNDREPTDRDAVMLAIADAGLTVDRIAEFNDLAALARRVRACTILIGAHGAGLTNAVFMERGYLIELQSLRGFGEFLFRSVALGHGLAYEGFDCRGPNQQASCAERLGEIKAFFAEYAKTLK